MYVPRSFQGLLVTSSPLFGQTRYSVKMNVLPRFLYLFQWAAIFIPPIFFLLCIMNNRNSFEVNPNHISILYVGYVIVILSFKPVNRSNRRICMNSVYAVSHRSLL